MKAKHVLISGQVQGVGFRYFVSQLAQLRKINGKVRNLEDGRVEVLYLGDENQWPSFYEALLKGSHASKVENILVSDVEIQQNLSQFTIEPSGVEPWTF